jgi:hypothetical protein
LFQNDRHPNELVIVAALVSTVARRFWGEKMETTQPA